MIVAKMVTLVDHATEQQLKYHSDFSNTRAAYSLLTKESGKGTSARQARMPLVDRLEQATSEVVRHSQVLPTTNRRALVVLEE